MNLTEVKKSLDKLFAKQPRQGAVRNIVFWYDKEAAFAEDIGSLALGNAKIIKTDDHSAFATKLYIEREDLTSNLLVYSPAPRPKDSDNWLTDTIKYSQTFSTDETSLVLLNYKMDVSLRSAVSAHIAFFHNNERSRKFDSYRIADFTESKLDVTVLSALCKLSGPSFDGCMMEILSRLAEGDTSLIEAIEKFASAERIWKLIRKNYGYAFAENNFEKLAIMLLVTHFSHSFLAALPKGWAEYNAHNTNCFVFVDNFMKNSDYGESYNALCDFVASKLNLSAELERWTVDDIIECDTCAGIDRIILSRNRWQPRSRLRCTAIVLIKCGWLSSNADSSSGWLTETVDRAQSVICTVCTSVPRGSEDAKYIFLFC
jgi:hypothetical protein